MQHEKCKEEPVKMHNTRPEHSQPYLLKKWKKRIGNKNLLADRISEVWAEPAASLTEAETAAEAASTQNWVKNLKTPE